jgi:hypothetical protein
MAWSTAKSNDQSNDGGSIINRYKKTGYSHFAAGWNFYIAIAACEPCLTLGKRNKDDQT